MRIQAADVTRLPWDDVSFMGMTWTEEGRDLEIAISGPGADDSGTLHCSYVHDLRIDLDFRDFSGRALSWHVDFEPVRAGGWTVTFDFGGTPPGALAFRCRDLAYEGAAIAAT